LQRDILVLEYCVGGGFSRTMLDTSILLEGYGMLNAIVEDLKTAGFRVVTTLDFRLKDYYELKADEVVKVSSSKSLEEVVRELVSTVSYALVIAPQTGGILHRLTALLEGFQLELLGSSSNAVLLTSDKAKLQEWLEGLGLKAFPRALTAAVDEDLALIVRKASTIGYPCVFKPVNGVGCEGISLVSSPLSVEGALGIVKRVSSRFLIQEALKGVHASVSLLASDGKTTPLTINAQKVILAQPGRGRSSYEGGYTPLKHVRMKDALNLAKAAVEMVPGLKGYVGVDLVSTRLKPFLMEVNARLTTSYLMLRRVITGNPAEYIVNACRGVLPVDVKVKGVAVMEKLRLKRPCLYSKAKFKKLLQLPFCVSVLPPLKPRLEEGEQVAILVVHADRLNEAKELLKEAKEEALTLFSY